MANGGIDSVEFFSALDAMAKERRINKDILFSAIESALISAYKKNFGKTANVRAVIDPVKGQVEVYSRKTVVEEVQDPQCEMTLADAREIRPQYEIGDLVEVPVTPRNFGRIAAQTGKQVVVQHLRAPAMDQEDLLLVAIGVEVQRQLTTLMIGRNQALVTTQHTVVSSIARHVGVVNLAVEQLTSRSCNYATITFSHRYSPCISL